MQRPRPSKKSEVYSSMIQGRRRKIGRYLLLIGIGLGLLLFIVSPYGGDPPFIAISHSPNKNPDQEKMVFIPAGEFIMGSSSEEVEKVRKEYGHRGDFVGYNFDKERPKRTGYVKAFYIDKYEVTNAQYQEFIDATGHPAPLHWGGGTYDPHKANYPVIKISWLDAKTYAEWAGKRLPTEEEWEKAARGEDGRIYPWGDKFNPENAGTAEGILHIILSPRDLFRYAAPVDEFKGDKSPYGAYDMAGNVMEWTDSWYERGKSKVIKGAAWVHLGPRARSATADGVQPEGLSHLVGFRCVADGEIDIGI